MTTSFRKLTIAQHEDHTGQRVQEAFVILHGSHNAFDAIGPYTKRDHAEEDVTDFYPGGTIMRITPPPKRQYPLVPPPGYTPENEHMADALSRHESITFYLTRAEYAYRLRQGWTPVKEAKAE